VNSLLVIPSIDIIDGHTVRVVQGVPELHSKEYGDDPLEMALIWRAENAKCIHIVDFDAAHDNQKNNLNIIEKICSSLVIPVQLGGGIRSFEYAQRAIEAGVSRLIIGTLAIDNRKEFEKILSKFGPSKISVAIDVVKNMVVTFSRTFTTNINPFEFAEDMVEMEIDRFVVTDVQRNGMLTGPNIDLCKKIAEITDAKVTLSGGIGNYKDLKLVQENMSNGIDSVIIGRALYENRFPCQKIWRIAESGIFN